mgnify:CR=1 FL=1
MKGETWTNMTNLLPMTILTLIAMHFGIPLMYYYYMKLKYLNKPWNIRVNRNYEPKVAIIIPTYMGSKCMMTRLNNI